MIWALDQDDEAGSSMNDLLGIGTANGVSGTAAESYKKQLANATLQQAVASSCYWSLCGGSCSPACSNPSAVMIARNTNSYSMNEAGQTTDLTCTGGFQAYCCVGFVPSSITNSGNLALYGRDGNVISKRDGTTERGLVEKRGAPMLLGGLGVLCLEAAGPLIALAGVTFGLSAAAEGILCAAATVGVVAIGLAVVSNGGGAVVLWPVGQWAILDFGKATPSTSSCDCTVTYMCRYGLGWDEVCDNQRWAISKMLNGQTVFHPFKTGRGVKRAYSSWETTDPQQSQRNPAYRTLVQGSRSPIRARCQLDEFPMGNLKESNSPKPQACRLINGIANMAQGRDYYAWKLAQWLPCSRYRETTCSSTDDGPPATWKFGPLNGNRGDGSGRHFIDAFGFDSQTPNSLCFASFTYTETKNTI